MTANQGSSGSDRIQLLTVKEAALMLREHPKTVYRMVSEGSLPWVNTAPSGKRAKIRFRQDRLNAFIEERERGVSARRRTAA